MERDQKVKGREMDTAAAKVKEKEKVNPPARKQAGKKVDVKCRTIAWNRP
jgi:hypothetical protein